MSTNLISMRHRSVSQVSLRKRILRTSSQDRPRKQLNKNSTATSFRPKLQRLINEGKIQQIVNSDNHSKANLYYTNHINDMQKQLGSSKKALSSMVLKGKSKQFNINKLKSEIKRFEMEREIIKSESERVNKIFEGTLEQLDSKKVQKQISEWNQRSYIYMKQRLSKDQNYFKAQYQYLQRQYETQKLRQKHLQTQSLQVLSHYKELQNFINTARQITSQQTNKKNQFIDLLNMQMQEKQFLNQLRIDKHKKEGQINQISSSVIEKQELNKYLNILYTHRILSKILKTKNNNLLKKYQKVQKAYMYIKSNTNIVEFDKILKKMQEQDSIYDVTVKKVASLEAQLQKMEKAIQAAKLERNKILSQEGETLNYQKDYYNGIQRDRYELLLSQKQKCQSRNMQDQILKNRIITWATRLFETYNVSNQKNTFQGNLKQLANKIKISLKDQEVQRQ